MRPFFILFVTCFISYETHSKEVWIYSDDGTWGDGIIALEQFFNHYNIPHKRIYASDLNNSANYYDASAICFPGGYSYNYKLALTEKTVNNIRNYVSNGGSYIGICAGAYFASSSVVWEGFEYPYSLSLFKGKAIGSMHSIAAWDNYNMTKISTNQQNSILVNSDKELNVLYYGGPHFESEGINYETLAFWEDYNKYPAIINFNFDAGKVLLIGPHLEIEEDSDRDSTNFAQELDDVESDWNFLYTIISWALNIQTSVTDNEKISMISLISPNPASEFIQFNLNKINQSEATNIQIYNLLGECVVNYEL